MQSYMSGLLGPTVDDVARDAAIAAYEVMMRGFSGDKSAYPCSDAIGDNVRENLHPFAVRIVKQHFPGARVVVIVRPIVVITTQSGATVGKRTRKTDPQLR